MKNSDEQLKKNIQDHRAEYDDYGFDSATAWDRLSNQLPKEQTPVRPLFNKKVFLRIAAIFAVICGVGIAYMAGLRNGKEEQAVAVKVQLPAEFVEAQNYYASQVNSKLEEVNKLDAGNKEIAEEIQLLQKEYQRLEKEMQKPVNKQEIINAMIENYKLRLALLESYLEEMKGDKQVNHETNSTI